MERWRLGAKLFMASVDVRLAGQEFQQCRHMSGLVSIKARRNYKRDSELENIIQREKKLNRAFIIRDIVVAQPGRTMPLTSLERRRWEIGLKGRRRADDLLSKFPAVFEMYRAGRDGMCVRLTEAAEALYDEEVKLRAGMAVSAVDKLRKLLMMAHDKRLAVEKIAHFQHDLALPQDWRTSILPNYPQYFKLVEGSALELTSWDPLLAVSHAQKLAAADEEVQLPLGKQKLNSRQLFKIYRARALEPYQSPYELDGTHKWGVELAKRACATAHELLSLMVEKRTLVDHLTHFKEEFKFPRSIRMTLLYRPNLFYISYGGKRDWVFLREDYRGSELVEKDPLVLNKERLNKLVVVSRTQRRWELRQNRSSSEGDQEGDDLEAEDEEDYESD